MSVVTWELWVDYSRTDADGLTHANVADAETSAVVEVGRYLLVGNEDADSAVAQVVEVLDNGVVLVRVMPGTVEANAHLVASGGTG